MLFDLFGDFAIEAGRPGTIRLRAIVRLADDLGVTEVSARAAAARMVQDGWLAAQRHGRESLYALTPRGRQLVEDGRQRIFSAEPDHAWDGTWYLVALSVPEARREVRDRLRKELTWLGFGSPSAGLYLSPRDHRPAIERLLDELEAAAYVQIYSATALRPADPRELVSRAWTGLEDVNRRYAQFLNCFAREFERTRADLEGGRLKPAQAFRTRFSLASQFRRCLFADPELPAELLPAAWWGGPARRLFLEYHALVTPLAMVHFDQANAASRPASTQAEAGSVSAMPAA
jgi:phenylacetic acid degradation operon negative regulatory protein